MSGRARGRERVLTKRLPAAGRSDVLLVLQQQRLVVRVQQRLDIRLQLLARPPPLGVLLPAARRVLLVRAHLLRLRLLHRGVGISVLLDVVDVRQARVELPPAHSLEHGHVLVVGVVPRAEGVEDVAEGFFALEVLFVGALEGLERGVVRDQGLVEGW